MTKICVGVPCQRTICSKTAGSLFSLTLDKSYQMRIVFSENCLVHENRNSLVKIAQDMKADYLFFVDSDIVFERDTLSRLLEADKDIIAASYNRRSLPEQGMVKDENMKLIDIQGRTFPFQCSYAPTGCMLIKISVFDKLEKPYFFFTLNDNGEMDKAEDYYFCDKARAGGFNIWCDPTIPVMHIGDYFY